jgi:caa(3)-type oxidase subunit IV
MAHEHGHEQKHVEPNMGVYVGVFIAIGVLVLVAAGVSFSGASADTRLVLNLIIASVQVALLSVFFMHLKQSDKLTWLIAAAGLFWLFLLFVLLLTDYVTRYYVTY